MRVVSLLPSATEIVYALGLADDLVGVTFECDHPPNARTDKTVVVGGQDTSQLTPREIDDFVRAQVAAGEDLYTLQVDALAGLAPDVILTQDLCRVCALPGHRVEEALEYLGCRADVVSLDPHSLEEVLETILTVGDRTGVASRAAVLVEELRHRLDTVTRLVASCPRPRVAVLEWVDPPFAAGHWVPDLVTAAGGEPVGGQPGGRSVETSWPAICAEEPDVIVVAPCGFDLDAALRQAEVVASHLPGIPIWAIDADGLAVRPGPRLVDGVEALAWLLHPEFVAAPPAGRVARLA
jgi:iron complex transport system substrate-binding protein